MAHLMRDAHAGVRGALVREVNTDVADKEERLDLQFLNVGLHCTEKHIVTLELVKLVKSTSVTSNKTCNTYSYHCCYFRSAGLVRIILILHLLCIEVLFIMYSVLKAKNF